jgi:hypothetical protein
MQGAHDGHEFIPLPIIGGSGYFAGDGWMFPAAFSTSGENTSPALSSVSVTVALSMRSVKWRPVTPVVIFCGACSRQPLNGAYFPVPPISGYS